MRIAAGFVLAFGLLAPAASFAHDAPDDTPALAALDDETVDNQFQCPETIVDADARSDALQRYMDWARERHPDWNFRKRLDVRYGLLRRHACLQTLANLAASQRPPFAP
jgi:hypothetical protein